MTLQDVLAFFILGLGGGATYAALGVGVVMTYRASGLVNFAHGAMTLYAVSLMAELRVTGRLVLPIGSISLGDEVSFWPAAGLALAYAAVQFALIYVVCFAPLHKAPPLAKIVASVGVMVAMQSLITLRFEQPRAMAPVLPNAPLSFLGVTVARDRLYLALVVTIGAGLVALWSNYTVFGKATRAAAEDERGAYLIGLNPQRIALVNWVAAGVLATAVGILIAPIASLEATTFTLLIVPALAAALIGRLSWVMVTALAGLTLGGLQSVLLLLTHSYDWLPQRGLKDGLPFIIVVLVVFFGGSKLPGRDSPTSMRLPAAPAATMRPLTTVAMVFAASIGLLVFPTAWQLALITSMVAGVLCLGLVVLTGYAGQISLAHMTLAGLAGFTLSKVSDGAGVPFPFSVVISVLFAAVAGMALGYPALRVRGLHLAVISLAAAVAIEEFLFKNPDWTGGMSGSSVPQAKIFGVSLGIRGDVGDFPRPAFGFMVLCTLTASAIGVSKLRDSDLGRRMLAVRSDELAAAAAGISVQQTRLAAIAISSALGGLGGSLIAFQHGQLSFASFGVFTSLSVLTAAYLGGIGSTSGALVGGALFSGGLATTLLDRWLNLGRYESVILGLALVAMAIVHPDGLAGALSKQARRLGSHSEGARS